MVISLRKTVDGSLVQVWDEDHFTTAESGGVHEAMEFARPPLPPPQVSQRDSRRSSCLDLPSPYEEARGQ